MNIKELLLFMLLLCVIVVVIVAIPGVIYIVKQQEYTIIERLGKFLKISSPGLHFKIPLIDNRVANMSVRIFQLDVKVETKTQDNVFVDVVVSVQYRVLPEKIYEAYYLLKDPEKQIKAFVFDVVRAQVPVLILDDLFAKKDNIATAVEKELQSTMHEFGYEIIKTLVTDINPNVNVKSAMNEINAAQRLRYAAIEKAEAEKIMKVKQAEAEAEANILHGQGIAGQRRAIIEGLSESVDEFVKTCPNATSINVLDMVLLVQYMDTLKEIGSNSKNGVIFMNHYPNALDKILDDIKSTLIASDVSANVLKGEAGSDISASRKEVKIEKKKNDSC